MHRIVHLSTIFLQPVQFFAGLLSSCNKAAFKEIRKINDNGSTDMAVEAQGLDISSVVGSWLLYNGEELSKPQNLIQFDDRGCCLIITQN